MACQIYAESPTVSGGNNFQLRPMGMESWDVLRDFAHTSAHYISSRSTSLHASIVMIVEVLPINLAAFFCE